jgi:hypothetical protein
MSVTTVSRRYAAIRTRIEAATGLRRSRSTGMNEDVDQLPDDPAFAFVVFTELNPEKQYLAGFGGGIGANLWRNPAVIDCYAFVPRGWGLQAATDLAETMAALFRGYRDGDLQCFSATIIPLGAGASIKPPGLDSEVDNYYAASVEIDMHFDQIG